MSKTLKALGLAAALMVSGAVTASAATTTLIDFTVGAPSNPANLSTASYTVEGFRNGNPSAILLGNGGPGAIAPIAGNNDGIGIKNDEVTYPTEWVTITFLKPVTLVSAYFLDVFFSKGGANTESANVAKGTAAKPVADASVFASVATSEGIGFASITGMQLKGTTFTFYAGPGADDSDGDVALAAIEIAPIPLPAGVLLFGTALGALGLARRRKRA